MNNSRLLLPNGFKITGLILLLIGCGFAIVRFYFGIKPEFLDFKLFAFYSVFLDSKFMQVITNNISEEITGIFMLLGLVFIGFARDKNESDVKFNLRIKALLLTIYIEASFLFISYIFMYGLAFVYMLIVNIYFPFIIFILIYRTLIIIESKR